MTNKQIKVISKQLYKEMGFRSASLSREEINLMKEAIVEPERLSSNKNFIIFTFETEESDPWKVLKKIIEKGIKEIEGEEQ